MLAFPWSFLLLPAVVGLGVAYVAAGRLTGAGPRSFMRAAILAVTVAGPFFTRGPGPAQLILGLLSGYLAIRMVALAQHRPCPERARAIVLALIAPVDVLRPAARPIRRPWFVAGLGCLGVAGCVLLLVLGNDWRLWQRSWLLRLLDDQFVVLEVAVGAAGLHGLIVGVAGLCGRSVQGLQDHPFRSTSLSEFWGRRWNRLVQSNLDRGFYRPLARVGRRRAGQLAAFFASGVLHVMAVEGAGPARLVALPCACVLAFFVVHGLLVLAEQGIGWHRAPAGRWSRAAARGRSLVLFLALSPGLIEPFAAVARVHGRSLRSGASLPVWRGGIHVTVGERGLRAVGASRYVLHGHLSLQAHSPPRHGRHGQCSSRP